MQKTADPNDGWKRHEREQLRARLALTFAERLAWLEQAKRFVGSALGAATSGRARVATLVRALWPDAAVSVTHEGRGGWSMEIRTARVLAIRYSPEHGFGASILRDGESDAFTGHDHAFDTIEALESHLRTLATP